MANVVCEVSNSRFALSGAVCTLVRTDALYSLAYNGSYMLPNMILALLIAGVLYVPLKKYYAGSDLQK